MYKNLLIATDGSELAERGLDEGLGLAKALGAKVSVLSVVVPLTGLALEAMVQGGAFDDYQAEVERNLAERRAAAEAKARAMGVTMDFFSASSESPAEAIMAAAESRGCDLIVMTSHGRGEIGQLVLGSKTAQVLAHCKLPVLVVR